MKTSKVFVSAAVALLSGSVLSVPAFAATENNNASENGGQALPQQGQSKAGISFGDDSSTGNLGDLRLYHVPALLDFGNHKDLVQANPNFTADGLNSGKDDNNTRAGYKQDSNETSVKKGTDLAYLQVVDEQPSRVFKDDGNGKKVDPNGNEQTANKYDDQAGTWTVNVKADGPMVNASKNDAKLTGVNLVFNSTTAAAQADGITLDAKGNPVVKAGTTPKDISSTIVVPMQENGKDVKVMSAAAGEGAGTSELDWHQKDIQLSVPQSQNSAIQDGRYEGTITWTLTSDVQ